MANTRKTGANKQLLSLLLTALVISSVISLATASGRNEAIAADDKWYVGEGVKPNMYVTYQISHFDTNNGRPFEMTIYFKEFNQDKHYWIAPVFVVDQGRVISGIFHLSDLDLTALGTSEIPNEMKPYRSAYTNTLTWLSAYTTKSSPRTFSDASWGKIGSIGGSEIKPAGTQEITIPAFPKPIQTVVVRYHKSVDSNIWILNEFPYPAKALTYVDVTTGNPPVQYQFQLMATGEGQPKAPASEAIAATPPLTKRTDRGDYFIQLSWQPEKIEPGKNTTFEITFMDNTQFPLSDEVGYDFKVTDAQDKIIKDLKNQIASGGVGKQVVNFNQTGPITVKVDIKAVGSRPPTDFVEAGEFNIAVVPEFPASTALFLAAVIGIVTLVARFRSRGSVWSNSGLFKT